MLFLIAALIAGNSCIYAIVCMQNNYLGLNVDDFDLLSCIGTSQYYTSLPNATLSYWYETECSTYGNDYTSYIYLNIDGLPNPSYAYDVEGEPVVNSITNNGNEIGGTKRVNGTIDFQLHYKFVNNPSTGINADTVEYELIATNITSSYHSVSLMFMIDTMVNGNDGANISTDDALSTVTTNKIFYKSMVMPPDWWDYDKDPKTGTPNLVGRGHLYNNPYDDPATEPDIFIVGNWPDMTDMLNSTTPWSLITAGSGIGIDSAVELWWTDGKGGGLNSRISFAGRPELDMDYLLWIKSGSATCHANHKCH